jgi:hypothetical protein
MSLFNLLKGICHIKKKESKAMEETQNEVTSESIEVPETESTLTPEMEGQDATTEVATNDADEAQEPVQQSDAVFAPETAAEALQQPQPSEEETPDVVPPLAEPIELTDVPEASPAPQADDEPAAPVEDAISVVAESGAVAGQNGEPATSNEQPTPTDHLGALQEIIDGVIHNNSVKELAEAIKSFEIETMAIINQLNHIILNHNHIPEISEKKIIVPAAKV